MGWPDETSFTVSCIMERYGLFLSPLQCTVMASTNHKLHEPQSSKLIVLGPSPYEVGHCEVSDISNHEIRGEGVLRDEKNWASDVYVK